MANLYGVANPAGYPSFWNTIGSANITCPTGTFTPIITTGNFVAPSAGYFFVMVWLNACVQSGATAVTSINFVIQIGAGAGVNGVGTSGNFAANATTVVPVCTATTGSQAAWTGLGSSVTVSAQPFGAQAIVENAGTWATFLLMRAPDQ